MKSAPSNVPKNTSVTVSDLAPPRVARLSLRVFALGLVLLVIWAAFGQIDQVTRAMGQVIVESRMQVIQSPDGGVLTELHVKEGDQVQNGQLLATFEKERTAAAVADSRAKVAALRTALARLHAEVYGTPLKFDEELKAYPEYIHNQTELYKKRQTAFHEDAAALERIIALSNAELQINQELEKSGDVSRTEVLRLQRSVADVKAQLLNKKNKYFQDAQTEMTKAQEDLNTQTETLRDRSQVLEHTTLNSPVDGVVNNIRVNTLGGVVRQGETVMEVMPTGHGLIVEAKVTPADIAYVRVGQDARVSVDAYDAAIYGALSGKVTYVSSDVLTEETKQGPASYYRIRILVEGPEGNSPKSRLITLKPGMSASVDIKAGRRSVLSYLAKPLVKTLSQSMGER